MTRHTLRAIAITMLTGALLAPAAYTQESKCNPCNAEERDRAVRRYQQEIERARREIAGIERQLSSVESRLDTALVRRLNERMQRAMAQLTRAHGRQAAHLQSLGERSRSPMVMVAPPANEWMTHAMDGYIGVLWSASVHVEKPKSGEALWTFHDYPHVEAVERESPAERAGIEVGDMILAFDGKDLRAGKIAMNAVLRPGSTVVVRLTRENRTRSLNVKVEQRPRVYTRVRTPRPPIPAEPPSAEGVIEAPEIGETPGVPPLPAVPRTTIAPAPLGAPAAFGLLGTATVGAEMIPLDETLGEPYGTDHGLLILFVGPRTPAALAGIQKGDVLISVDGRELRSVPALIRAFERAEKADKSELRIELLRKRDRKVVMLQW
jgi:membrane-associated protease RseP (regulator of RpoE activity)